MVLVDLCGCKSLGCERGSINIKAMNDIVEYHTYFTSQGLTLASKRGQEVPFRKPLCSSCSNTHDNL